MRFRHVESFHALPGSVLLLILAGAADLRADGAPPAPAAVRIWEEPLIIPTYELGPPDRNPIFYTNESYQGAQRRVYPYALQDDLRHVRGEKSYRAVYLENEFVQICVLPELGGRLFSAHDKTNGYDIFYRQHVIKPALIGMLGAWISGGIEWCVFHHHRNTTFMPVDYTLVENPDGSGTVWFGETERRHRMRWLIGLTLHPGKSFVEATVKFFNRTPQAHSMLYWANVAVHVNDDYQVIFPPSVQAATYHSKIDFTAWPIARGKYRGHDYTDVDISWWKNSSVSNSFFAWDLREDFMGGYDHGKRAGVVHVGNHHVVCGAKLWEWGTGSYGRMWDSVLTDEDGPYAELMVGAFSDNQPDYSWIKPHEVRTATQHWYPVREIGGFKHATLEGAVNLELESEGAARLGFATTSRHANATAVLEAAGDTILRETIEIGPGKPFAKTVAVPADTVITALRASLLASGGEEILVFQPVEQAPSGELPKPVRAPRPPEEIETADELYWTGLRIEQIHNPRVDPNAYFEEALRRDPGDARANTALGARYNKAGAYDQAAKHLRRAIERAAQGYTRVRTTEAYYQLGIASRALGEVDDARDSFYRATWDYEFRAVAYYQLAELACLKGELDEALGLIDEALATNTRDTKALGIRAAILRKLGRPRQALRTARSVVAIDPLDFLARNELCLSLRAVGRSQAAERERERATGDMRGDVQTYLELAADYMGCGLWDEAIVVLRRPVDAGMEFAATYPIVHYYLGHAREQEGERGAAEKCYERASRMPLDYCFPFRSETRRALEAALALRPGDARAWYYLGNLRFESRPQEAIASWKKAVALDGGLALAHRNLGWAYYRTEDNVEKAIASYERAIDSERGDARLLLELDTLYELANVAPSKRLEALEGRHDVVKLRNESFVREIAVLVLVGRYDKAIEYLTNNFFHIKEGGGGIHDVYVDAHMLRGLELLGSESYDAALRHFEKASEYPTNLSVGRPKNDRRASQVAYVTALAHQGLGDEDSAAALFRASVAREGTRSWPGAMYYQGLCHAELGDAASAKRTFEQLIDRGTRRLGEKESADFFAKFGGAESRRTRRASAHYTHGLGLLGMGRRDDAERELRRAVELDLSHVWAQYQLRVLTAAR